MAKEHDPAIRLTAAILAVDALVLLGLYVSIASTSPPPALTPAGVARGDGNAQGIEGALWLLLVPIALALVAMVWLGIREIVGLRDERKLFARRPPEEQRRLRATGSALHGVSVAAPPVADRLSGKKHLAPG